MAARRPVRDPARTPEALNDLLSDAFNRSDLDALAEIYGDDATLVVPPDGRSVHGRDEIRAAASPIFACQPHLTSVVVRTLRAGDIALTHAMWELVVTAADGSRMQHTGRGTIVSQSGPDGTWRVVIDDPLSQGDATGMTAIPRLPKGSPDVVPDVLDDAGATQPAQPAVRRWRLRRRPRNTLLTIHIIVSVALLGDSAGFLAVAIRRSISSDPALVESSHELLGMFALYFGIPLSVLALLTGAALGVLTRWGLFRYPWVIAKLALILSVILVGATVLRPVLDNGAHLKDTTLIAGAAYDVAALTLAAALSVFRPGRPFRYIRHDRQLGRNGPH
jgi:uncharacterized protein (TIGR02246 family)